MKYNEKKKIVNHIVQIIYNFQFVTNIHTNDKKMTVIHNLTETEEKSSVIVV